MKETKNNLQSRIENLRLLLNYELRAAEGLTDLEHRKKSGKVVAKYRQLIMCACAFKSLESMESEIEKLKLKISYRQEGAKHIKDSRLYGEKQTKEMIAVLGISELKSQLSTLMHIYNA